MSNGQRTSQGVTEGKSAYNKHATLQAAGGALAYPLFELAARDIDLGPASQPIVIADYGSSQGKNSIAPMRSAIETLRRRAGGERPILVFHIDQPSNDFNTLFQTFDSRTGKYSGEDTSVYSCAIGKSFYGNVLPAEYVHLGWSAYAAVWLSQIPMAIPGHIIATRATGVVRAAFERQGKEDWEGFLTLRANELRPEGRLVVTLPALADDGSWGTAGLMDHANAALAEMVDAREITAEERAGMTLGTFPRRKLDLLAPFVSQGEFSGLAVEHCAISVIPHPAWSNYEQHGDKEVLATELALFFRSTFMPSLATALARNRDSNNITTFGGRLEERLARRLAGDPAPLLSFVATLVVVKRSQTA